MKIKIFLITACMALIASYAAAGWLEDFKNVFIDAGIDEAVVEALKQGAVPDDIMENGLQFEALNPQNLVKAMYCGGIRGDDIRAAGQKYDVSDIIIVAGYKKSVEECGDQVVDTQAYTPTASVISFAGPAALANGSTGSLSNPNQQ
jgi:hypothetical protein